MLETDALKEKLEMELHRFARPPEELSSGDPYFEQLQTMLAIRDELINIPLCDIQRNMLLSMENVLESAWSFRNTPVPDRCMNPNNISEVVYYFLQDKGAEYRGDLLYERAKAEFDARMEELAALPPKEILDHAYEKIIKEDFLCHLEEGLDEWETDALLSYPQPLTALYTEWMGNDYSYLDIDRIQSTATQAAGKRLNELRRHEFDVMVSRPWNYGISMICIARYWTTQIWSGSVIWSHESSDCKRRGIWPAVGLCCALGYERTRDSRSDSGHDFSLWLDRAAPRRFCGGASCYGRSVPVGCITDTWENPCHWRWGH